MMRRRVFIMTDFAAIEVTDDDYILRNLDWTNPRILVEYCAHA